MKKDTLILTDSNGDTLTCLKTLNAVGGLHSINKDNELIYIDDNHNIITLANNMEIKKTNTSIKSTEWKPNCLFYSRSTGDLLVGMYAESEGEGKIIRYSQSREQTQTIKHDSEGYNLYSKPCYIVENNNFDVVVSDSIWRTVDNSSEESSAIVVTERRGRHRFTYRGHPPGSRIVSRGLCIDALSYIIFCDNKTITKAMPRRYVFVTSFDKATRNTENSRLGLRFQNSPSLGWIKQKHYICVQIYNKTSHSDR